MEGEGTEAPRSMCAQGDGGDQRQQLSVSSTQSHIINSSSSGSPKPHPQSDSYTMIIGGVHFFQGVK